MINFLEETKYINYSDENIVNASRDLFYGITDEVEKARIAYVFVRDSIPHSFDINAQVITVKASDVLKYKTGICHAKANLLCALMRSVTIPTGFCFQHITLNEDDSNGYCVHCYNAIFLNNKWIKVDATGNTNGKNAQFSLDVPKLAYDNRSEYNEYYWKGIYSAPHKECMIMLENAKSLSDILENIPDYVYTTPDVAE